MDEAEAWKSIASLWSEDSLHHIVCLHCEEIIPLGTPFARTFSVKTLSGQSLPPKELQWSNTFELYHRHLECLFKSARYVAVSHVWDSDVADLQYKKRATTVSAKQVHDVLINTPSRIAQSLLNELSGSFEVFHDYISVPQWTDDVKRQIILQIPQIYKLAKCTVAWLADVDQESFASMRTASSMEERCCGMGNICSAAWFSRVWTAMELAHSPEVRIMVNDFKIMPLDAQDPPITHELWRRWRDEVKDNGFGRNLEAEVWQRGNLVPWQLGTVIPTRLNNLQGRKTCFGVVHSLLSRRRLTIQRDFLYALEGLMRTGLPIQPSVGTREIILGMAHRCIASGDFSPMLMKPASAPSGLGHMDLGYADHATWGLGVEQMPPTYHMTQQLDQPFSIVVQVEEIGVFRFANSYIWALESQMSAFRKLCQMALETCGSDTANFVNTVGVRLYGQLSEALDHRLAKDNRYRQLNDDLNLLRRNFEDKNDFEISKLLERIADTMGLSNTSLGDTHEDPQTPMTFLEHHGSTSHHSDLGAIVQLTCTKCYMAHLVRIALFKPVADLQNAKAYRIPGLKYRFSHAGGVGFLLQDNRMVGRFLWAYPTCQCPTVAEVTIVVDDIPLPSPNHTRFEV